MTDPFLFRLNGTPRPKARPRFVGKRVVTATKATEKLWRAWLLNGLKMAVAFRGDPAPLFTAPVRVRMIFTFESPASAGDRIGTPHGQKPDKDNLEKLVLDAMVKAGVLKDDSLVAGGEVEKWWGERGGVVVLAEPIDGLRAQAPSAVAAAAPAWLATKP